MLNEDIDIDIDIGIEDPIQESDSSGDDDDFSCLAKLRRRKSSPIKRLLRDVNACMNDFFECMQICDPAMTKQQQVSPPPPEKPSLRPPLKTEAHLATE